LTRLKALVLQVGQQLTLLGRHSFTLNHDASTSCVLFHLSSHHIMTPPPHVSCFTCHRIIS
jgi:hypothetical protein